MVEETPTVSAADAPHLIFVHIPKAAGSTLKRILRYRHARAEAVFLDVDREEEQLQALRDMAPAARSRVRILGGHHPYGLHEYFSEPSAYITAVRDPVQRVVSLYRYGLSRPGHYLHDALTEGMSLEELVRSGVTTETDNGQVRFIAGHNKDIPYGACGEAMLQKAKDHIERHFAGVAVAGDFDRSLVLASHRLGWARPPVYNDVNVNSRTAARVSASALQVIAEHNALDIELFAWVKARLQAQWEAEREVLEPAYRRFLLRKRLYQNATNGVLGLAVNPLLQRMRRRRFRLPARAVAR